MVELEKREIVGVERPRVATNTAFWDEAKARGWQLLAKKGWPTYVARIGGEVALVTIRRGYRARLRQSQYLVMEALTEGGVPCYVWTPRAGLVRFGDMARVTISRRGRSWVTAQLP